MLKKLGWEHYGIGVKIEPTFIDSPDAMTAPEMATLMREAGDFYLKEIE